MASSILRWISRKAAARSPPLPNSLNSCCGCGGRSAATRRRRIGTMSAVSDESVICPSTLPSRISPWLMLPPAVEDNNNNMVYKFYSLAEDKIISLKKRGGGVEEEELPDDDLELKGSSHGWLAWFNPRNCDLFLSNPLSRRHVKLPPIHTLSIPECNLEGGYGCVRNVIISCSPDEEECRAMMSFGTEDRLAFCCPGRSTEWTHIGELYDSEEDEKVARCYESFVYSSTHKLFFCVTQYGEFEAWDLQDPSSPRLTTMDMSCDDDYPWPARSEEEAKLKKSCRHLPFLVVDHSASGQLYQVYRHVMEEVAPDGSYVVDEAALDMCPGTSVPFDPCIMCKYSDMYPYKTIGFDVHKYDVENNELRYMESSLDGLAFFIGNNHSFALRASEFPEFKPNSIYFTDVDDLIPSQLYATDPQPPFGGHDIGVFNYEDGTFSLCYYPGDVKSIRRIIPPPTWFTPSPL